MGMQANMTENQLARGGDLPDEDCLSRVRHLNPRQSVGTGHGELYLTPPAPTAVSLPWVWSFSQRLPLLSLAKTRIGEDPLGAFTTRSPVESRPAGPAGPRTEARPGLRFVLYDVIGQITNATNSPSPFMPTASPCGRKRTLPCLTTG